MNGRLCFSGLQEFAIVVIASVQRKKTDWKVVNVDTETEKEHFVKHDGEVNRERRRKTYIGSQLYPV